MRHRVKIERIEPIGDGPDGSVWFRIDSMELEAFAVFVGDFVGCVGLTVDVDLHALDIEVPEWDGGYRTNEERRRGVVRRSG